MVISNAYMLCLFVVVVVFFVDIKGFGLVKFLEDPTPKCTVLTLMLLVANLAIKTMMRKTLKDY